MLLLWKGINVMLHFLCFHDSERDHPERSDRCSGQGTDLKDGPETGSGYRD